MFGQAPQKRFRALLAVAFGGLLAAAVPAAGAMGSWTSVDLPGDTGPVQALLVDPVTPSTLYAGTVAGRVLKSTDSGTSWAPADAGLPTGVDVQALASHPSAPQTLYAGTFAHAVYKSIDGGANWSPADNGLVMFPGAADVRSLAIHPTKPAILYAATADGVYRSDDAGANWAPRDTGIPETDITSVAISPSNPDLIFAGAVSGLPFPQKRTLFRSVDGGGTWASAAGVSSDIAALSFNRSSPEVLHASAGSLFRVTNGGATSEIAPVFSSSPPTDAVHDPIGGHVFLGTLGGGVRVGPDTAQSANAQFAVVLDAGLLDLNVSSLAAGPATTRVYAGMSVGAVANLQIPVADLEVSVPSAARSSFTVRVKNLGPEPAPHAHLDIPFVGGLNAAVSMTPSSGTCNTSRRYCQLGTIAPGGEVTVTTATSSTLGTGLPMGSAISVRSLTHDANTANNVATIPSVPPPAFPPPTPPTVSTARRSTPSPRITALAVSCRSQPTRRCSPRIAMRLSAKARVRVSILRLPTLGRVASFVVHGREGSISVRIPKVILAKLIDGRYRIVARPMISSASARRATLRLQ